MLHHARVAASTGRTAALKCVVNVGSGPFMPIDTQGGLQTFATGAKASTQNRKSGPRSLQLILIGYQGREHT
jgi:hypothetical protein